jgi:hypothetical protein
LFHFYKVAVKASAKACHYQTFDTHFFKNGVEDTQK